MTKFCTCLLKEITNYGEHDLPANDESCTPMVVHEMKSKALQNLFTEAAPQRPVEFNEEEEFQLIVENAEKARRRPGSF